MHSSQVPAPPDASTSILLQVIAVQTNNLTVADTEESR